MEAIINSEHLYLIVIMLTFVAFFAGFVDAVAGGGGLILAPTLLLVGITPQFTLGTNKFIAIFGTTAAVINFARKGKIIWKIALIGVVGALIGSIFGARSILLFEEETVAKIILAILPFTVIVAFIPKKKIKTEINEFTNRDLYIKVPIISLILGFYDGFFGPGTGTFLTLFFYTFLGMNLVNSSAISRVINLSSGIGSFITFAMAGKILYLLGLPLIVGSVTGGFIGSKMAMTKGQKFIKYMIIVVFIILFASLLYKYLSGAF